MLKKKTTIKNFLSINLNSEELSKLNRSFEIVGDIAIYDIPIELEKYEKEIGNAILKVNCAIKVVLKKSGIHSGVFRTQKLIHIAGEERFETIYKENGISLLINPETVYFSSKLSTEREILLKNLKENDRILVMFSGGGPYSFVGLKKQPNLARITNIEINPEGHKYALKSLELNKNILKKSKIFINLIKFLKENNIFIKEKEIILKLNKLKIHFINADVKSEIKEFKLKKYVPKIENFHNELFNSNPKDLFNFLNNSNFREIYLDLDDSKLNFKKILYFLILSSYEFKFICKILGKKYMFDSNLDKSYLLNYLEGNYDIKNIKLYDEIFMPLPKDAYQFLEDAFKAADKNCIIHMYDFLLEEEFPFKSENLVKEYANKFNKKIDIIQTRKVGQYSPRKYRVCVDFKVLN